MARITSNQWTITKIEQNTHLLTWVEAFLIDRKAQGLSQGTLYFYQNKLALFNSFCETKIITEINQITPADLREYMLHLEETGHNEGGRHACYRAVKTFLYWWEEEVEPDGWSNPIRKGKPPRIPSKPLDPADLSDIKAMMDTCDKTFYGLRDKAILLAMLDTGARAQEILDMKLSDFSTVSGEVLIRHGKGGKFRTVFLGKTSRRAVRAYLKHRLDSCDAIWTTQYGEHITYCVIR